jgi:hypothetical protein
MPAPESSRRQVFTRGNDDRRVGTGSRTETGTRRAPFLGNVSLHALPWLLLVGDGWSGVRAWEAASLRALFPREGSSDLGTVGPSRAGTVTLG